MRISDWSSDVCSSDLRPVRPSTALHGKSTNGPGRKPSPSPPIPSSRVRMHAQPDIRSAGDLVYSRAPADRPSSHKLVETHLGLVRSEEHTYELQSLMRISYAVVCLTKKHSLSHTC